MDSSDASVDDYDVFLSFRGVDTRQGFTDVLHEFMTMVEIRVFRDDDKLAIGDKIESILAAIDSSRICIPIFSPKFAESKWCLREVSRMVDLKKTIVPIFYKVSPDDVKLKGASVYSDDFRKHEENHGNLEEVEKWKKALKEAASNKGRTLGDKSYTGFGKELVDEVLSKLGPRKRLDLDHFVGDKNKEAAMKLLEMDSSSNEVVCVGIHGMGGIGKTTMTKLIYNEFLSKFDYCGFLPDIREFSKRKGIKDLPKYLYDNLEPKLPGMVVINRSEQIPGIFKNKKVLLILDDVDNYEQIKEIAREPCRWFGSGSRIILTTRDKKVVEDYIHESGSEIRYLEMRELDRGWGLELFSKCAFGTDLPPSQYQQLSESIVAYAGGLPLTITVAGKYLRNQTKIQVWEEFFARLRKSPHKEVKDKLMISYESLEDEQKTIFLDIACFFINSCVLESKGSQLLNMWQACSLLPHLSLQVLQSRALVKINPYGVIWMHDQLRDLGRDIVKNNTSKLDDVMQQSRLWEKDDILEVLKYKEKKKNIEAIQIRDRDYNTNYMHYEFSGFDNLRFLILGRPWFQQKISATLPKLRWLSLKHAFEVGNLVLPTLVGLDLSEIDADETWVGWNQIQGLGLKSLKLLYATSCRNLRRTPVFTKNMSGLERLDLTGCIYLAHVGPSIDKLQHLTSLSLARCYALHELPEELCSLGNLTTLDLSYCENLSKVPESLGELHSLRELNLQETSIRSLPVSIGRLKNLQCLYLMGCDSLVSLPETLGNLHSLKKLDLIRTRITSLPDSIGRLEKLECLNLGPAHPDSFGDDLQLLISLPDSFGDIPSLINLDLSYSDIRKLPSTISQLSLLQFLKINECDQLQEVPELPTSLIELEIKSNALSRVHDLSNLQHLTSLKISGGDILDWDGSFPGNKLQSLSIKLFSISRLPDLSNCCQLIKFKLQCGYSLKVLPNLLGLRKLDTLKIQFCEELIDIPGIGNMLSLTSLRIVHCPSLVSLENVGQLKQLKTFNVFGCYRLTEIPGLFHLKSLRLLNVQDCYSGELLRVASQLEKLHGVEVLGMPHSNLNNNVGISYPDDELQSLDLLQNHICGSPLDQMGKMAGHMEVNNGNVHHQPLDLDMSQDSSQDDQATNQAVAEANVERTKIGCSWGFLVFLVMMFGFQVLLLYYSCWSIHEISAYCFEVCMDLWI